MSGPVIRPLSIEQLQEALRLSTMAGWNQRLEDWQVLLRLAEKGAFAALIDGRVAGTALAIDYGRFAWIAMMLVDPAHRGRGLGRGLLETAIAAAAPDRPIRLDATSLGRPLYQKYGFEDEAHLSRHVIDATLAARPGSQFRQQGSPSSPPSEGRAVPWRLEALTAAGLASVIETDRETFGGTRAAALEWAFSDAPQYAYTTCSISAPLEYCLGRHGRMFDQIGPVVAGDDHRAYALVRAALAAAGGRPVAIDSFDGRSEFTAMLRRIGFVPQRPLVRMRRDPRSSIDRDAGSARIGNTAARGDNGGSGVGRDKPTAFAIFGPEFG